MPQYRRTSWNSKYRAEYLHKKMNSVPFGEDVNISYDKSFDNLYKIDPNTGVAKQITRVTINGTEATVYYSNGSFAVTTVRNIYEIEQLFGGAWAAEVDNGVTKYTNAAMNEVFRIICDNDLKSYMIAIAANKSACKVGVANLNKTDVWSSPTGDIWSFEMSTKFSGLQMDAEHGLEDSEVTEPTQMISALEQMGNSHELVAKVYAQLGQYCIDSIEEIKASLSLLPQAKKEALMQIFGKALIDSFKRNDRDTLGLAQAFLANAQKSIKDNKIEYNIPVSSSSINGIFNSEVVSTIVKKGIRRKFDGIASVLNPSHGLMQYYEVNGAKYRYDELVKHFASNQELVNTYGTVSN